MNPFYAAAVFVASVGAILLISTTTACAAYTPREEPAEPSGFNAAQASLLQNTLPHIRENRDEVGDTLADAIIDHNHIFTDEQRNDIAPSAYDNADWEFSPHPDDPTAIIAEAITSGRIPHPDGQPGRIRFYANVSLAVTLDSASGVKLDTIADQTRSHTKLSFVDQFPVEKGLSTSPTLPTTQPQGRDSR